MPDTLSTASMRDAVETIANEYSLAVRASAPAGAEDWATAAACSHAAALADLLRAQ
jgi:hypothetical protein